MSLLSDLFYPFKLLQAQEKEEEVKESEKRRVVVSCHISCLFYLIRI